MTVVLMYHALFRASDTSLIDQEDLPYAISEAAFAAQLDNLAGRRAGLFESGQSPDVVITFDDGHCSNLEIAAPLLCERGLSACFFVTTDFIDTRPGFMSGSQLVELASLPGMLIGSHGVSHRFLDDLSECDSLAELIDSRKRLESITGRACQSISFPGGRYHEQTLTLVRAAGYRQWFGSDIGTLSLDECFDAAEARAQAAVADAAGERVLLSQHRSRPLERTAVRRSTSMDEFARMIEPDQAYYRQHRRRSQVKSLARRVMGNRLYHGLYKSFSAR
jgi:peptidoglycan/xylan/chitin deacetylase (PgdA/CDA1 family)